MPMDTELCCDLRDVGLDEVDLFAFLGFHNFLKSQPAIHKNLKRLFKILVEEVSFFSYTSRGLMSGQPRYFKII
jgi:hypothetical protein